jgi:hypothetical protein
VPVPAERTLYWRPEGSVTTPSFSLFVARNARPATFVAEAVAKNIAPKSKSTCILSRVLLEVLKFLKAL